MSPTHRMFLRPAGDALLLFVALAVANALIGRPDPGWLSVNPAPFLAVPVLIGARYGFLAGLSAGLATVAGILGARLGLIAELPATTWAAHPITLTAFPILGAISGELRRLYAAKLRRLESSNQTASSDKERLEREVDLLREANRSLSHNSALHGAELAALDLDLRDILSSGNAGILGNTLDFLRRSAGVEEAAIFHRQGRSWIPIASTLRDQTPPSLDAIGRTMATKACQEKDLVTWAGLWHHTQPKHRASKSQAPDPVGPWLAALPWDGSSSGEPDSVLMVRTLPLRHASWENFARITTICRWVTGLALARPASSPSSSTAPEPVSAAQFRSLLHLATVTASQHRLPSALLALQPSPDQTHTPSPLAAQLAATLRPNDLFTPVKSPHGYAFAALLPLAGQRDAAEILARLKNHASGHIIPVDGHTTAHDLWLGLLTGKPLSSTKAKSRVGSLKSASKASPRAEPA